MEFEIRPPSRFKLGFRELWEYKELFYYFTWRDIKVKYKQTVLGFLWAVLQPLVMAMLFTFFLGKAIAGTASLDMPYDLFALSGLVLWNIFSSGLNTAGNSMVTNANIIRKIYFPRLIIPASSVLLGLFDFIMAFIVFTVYVYARGYAFSPFAFIYLPAAVALTCLATLGAGSLLGALNVKFRDFRYIIPFLIQLLLFVSPVIYPVNISENQLASCFFAVNPMTGALELFRASIAGHEPSFSYLLSSTISGLVLLVAGLVYFKKTESYFADLV